MFVREVFFFSPPLFSVVRSFSVCSVSFQGCLREMIDQVILGVVYNRLNGLSDHARWGGGLGGRLEEKAQIVGSRTFLIHEPRSRSRRPLSIRESPEHFAYITWRCCFAFPTC